MISLLAHSGDSFVVMPCLFILWLLGDDSLKTLAVSLAIGSFSSLVITSVIKYTIRRTRPPGEWGKFYRKTDPYSFPSGHSANTMTLSMIMLLRFSPGPGFLMIFWAGLVGFSRIFMGVHYLSDITGGYILGVLVGLIFCVIVHFGRFF